MLQQTQLNSFFIIAFDFGSNDKLIKKLYNNCLEISKFITKISSK